MAASSEKRSLLTTLVALALTGLYIFACWFLVNRFALENPLPDAQWQRALVIFSGISSVGFAAIGVLLGTTVQQVNVSAAREQAANAKAEAEKKTGAIKNALATLHNTGKPDDVGGGAPERISTAHRILLDGLA